MIFRAREPAGPGGAASVLGLLASASAGILVAFSGSLAADVMLLAATFGLALILVLLTQRGVSGLTLALMAVTAFALPMNGLRLGGPVAVGDLVLAVAVGLIGLSRLAGSTATPYSHYGRFLLATSVMVLGGLVGTFFTADLPVSLADLLRFTVSTAGIFLLFLVWAPDRHELRVLTWAFTAGAVVNVTVGILYISDYTGRAVGLSVHSNHLGMSSALGFGAAVGLALTSSSTRRFLAVAMAVILTVGVVLSGSRAALGAEVVAVLVVLVITQNWRLLRAASLITIIAVAALSLGLVDLPASNALTRAAGDSTAQRADEARAEYLAQTLEELGRHPVTGVGFDFAKLAHNVYLQVLVSAGLVGLLGFLGIVFLVRQIAFSTVARRDLWVAAMVSSYVGYLAAATVSNILWDRWLWFYLALVVGVYVTAPPPSNRRDDPACLPATSASEAAPSSSLAGDSHL